MTQRRILFAPLALIRSAACPLNFRATPLGNIAEFSNLVQQIPAIGELEVGDCLRHESIFPYTDANKHRKLGCQLVTAPLGLAPEDLRALFGIYTYAYSLDRTEKLGEQLTITLTMNQLARHAGFAITSKGDTRRLQSRVFRLSFVKLTNTAVWRTGQMSCQAIENASLFDISDMSLLIEPWRPVTLQLSHKFVELMRGSPRVAFDLDRLQELKTAAKRRLFLIVSREGWNYPDSQIYSADDFAVHQIGYARHDDVRRDADRRRRRLHDLKSLLREFEERDLIRPYKPWKGYFTTPSRGPLSGQLCVRWSRGPAIRSKETTETRATIAAEDDPLYDQVKVLKDHEGMPLSVPAYRHLLKEYSRNRLQRHISVILAQKQCMPTSFSRSEVAAFVDRVQKDHPAPDWYSDELKKARRELDVSDASPELQQVYQSMTLSV